MATTRTATGARKLIEATKRDALAARYKKLTSLSALIRRRLGTVVESFYDIGVALTEIQTCQRGPDELFRRSL